MRKLSVVIDTNLFISSLILPKGNPSRLISLWKKNAFTLVSSQAMIEELELVLARPKYEKIYGVNPSKKERLIKRIREQAFILSSLTYPQIEVRDTKDIVVLATAVDANADYLVTGDKDLLALKHKLSGYQLQILTVDEFLKKIHRIRRLGLN